MSKVHFANVLEGAASVKLFGPRLDAQVLIDKALKRADAEGTSDDAAINTIMRERFYGQMAVVVLVIICMSIVLIGVQRQWNDLALALIAFVPAVVMVTVHVVQHRRDRAQKKH